jgi:hypothetical protein
MLTIELIYFDSHSVKSSLSDAITVILLPPSIGDEWIYRGRTGKVGENVYLYDVPVSTCLAHAYEDYICLGEVSFFVVSKISKLNKEQ